MSQQSSHAPAGRPVLLTVALTAGLAFFITVPASADEMRTWIESDGDGSYTRVEHRGGAIIPAAALASAADRVMSPNDQVIWHNYLTDAVYTTTGISASHGSVITGTWLNPPQEVQLIPLEGDGTPSWTDPGTMFEVAASRNAEVVAAVDSAAGDITLSKWHPDSSVPDWAYRIENAALASHRALVVSPDGSTIAVLVTMQGDRGFARLYCFDADSNVPLGTFDMETDSFGRNICITEDGRYICFFSRITAYVYDRDAGALRYSVSAGASNDAVGISGSGEYLAYGWQTLYVRRWNGSTYELLFTRPGGGEYLRHCVFSADDSTLVTAWNPTTHKQNRLELHELPSSTPLWSHQYEYGSGEYQDIIDDVAMTADAGYIAAASWGDIANTNPEVHVFTHDGPNIAVTVDTPGSMFDVDIATAWDGTIYLTACGKHVHANEQGRGGDLYSVLVKPGCPGDFDHDGDVDTADLLFLLGAWGTPDGDVNGDGDTDTADLLDLLAAWGECPGLPCPWDFNGDGVVDDLDRDILMEHWGDCPDPPEECPWDLNGDGVVDGTDLIELLEHYGDCP
jgi:hypothetical protein